METQIILTTNHELRSLLREELQAISNDPPKTLEGGDEIMRRSDIAELFGVSLVTVHAWMKSGQIPFHRIGGRTYFKKNEVMASLKPIKIRRKSI